MAHRAHPLGAGSGRVLAVEELVAGKVLALFSRAEARDFVDTWQLSQRFGRPRLFELAGEKDDGLLRPYRGGRPGAGAATRANSPASSTR